MKIILPMLLMFSFSAFASEEASIEDFLEASREARSLEQEGQRVCRVVCFPCCYAPRSCETICEDRKPETSSTNAFQLDSSQKSE